MGVGLGNAGGSGEGRLWGQDWHDHGWGGGGFESIRGPAGGSISGLASVQLQLIWLN